MKRTPLRIVEVPTAAVNEVTGPRKVRIASRPTKSTIRGWSTSQKLVEPRATEDLFLG